MPHTAIAGDDSGLSQAQLAHQHGLRPAGLRPSLPTYTRQLWFYRHFITAHANARLIASFSSARLGRLWQLLTPLTNAAVYYLIFGVVLNTKGTVPNFIAYLCTGLFVFAFTQTALVQGTQSITGNLGLIRVLHFPRASLPISVTITQFEHLIASMVVLIGIVLVTGEPITAKWLLAIPALLLQTVFNVGLTMTVARVGSKVADLKQLMPFITRTWMYASGVLYSVTLFEQHLPGWAAELLRINPLLVYIELVRYALLETTVLASTPRELWILGIAWAVVVGIAGYVYFWLGEKEYGRG